MHADGSKAPGAHQVGLPVVLGEVGVLVEAEDRGRRRQREAGHVVHVVLPALRRRDLVLLKAADSVAVGEGGEGRGCDCCQYLFLYVGCCLFD